MSKRNVDGDVLVNRLNVGLANHRRLLASWTGLNTDADSKNGGVEEQPEEDNFKDEALGHEQIGVGGKIPKDILDGSFTRRSLTSNDKLLQQLMGKKAAKRHMDAKLAPPKKEDHKVQKFGKPEESEDEEEGRAAAFKSKKRKTSRPKQEVEVEEPSQDLPGAPEADIPLRPANDGDATEETVSELATRQTTKEEASEEDAPQSTTRSNKKKSASYLDELLAKRAAKKEKKKGKQDNKLSKKT